VKLECDQKIGEVPATRSITIKAPMMLSSRDACFKLSQILMFEKLIF